MHVRDYLHDIPLKALKTIAETLKINVEYRARIKLMNAIDRAFWDASLADRLIGELSERHQRVLAVVAFSFGAGIREQALVRRMDKIVGMKRTETLAIIDDIIPLALVGGIEDDEERRYFSPEGVACQVRRFFIIQAGFSCIPQDSLPPFSPPNLLEDVYSFISSVSKERLPLTLMGNIRKASLDRVFTGSPTCEDDDSPFPREKRDSFVVNYCTDRELIIFNHRNVVEGENVTRWINRSTTERINDLTAFAATDRLQDPLTIVIVSGVLKEMGNGESVDVHGLAGFLDEFTAAPGGLKRLDARLTEMFAILHHLGLFHRDGDCYSLINAGERLFHGESLVQDERLGGHFMVQPNFEIIVGPEFEPRLRFQLEIMADCVNRDTVLTYAVTRESVVRARERNMGTEEILAFFRDHSRTDIPQNVRFSIESWANSYGAVCFETHTLMRCRTKEMCEGIVHVPDIAPFVIERLSDTDLIVKESNIPLITELLKKAGYQPEAYEDVGAMASPENGGFKPVSLRKLIEIESMPDIHHAFVFPEPPEEEEEGA